MAQGIAQLEAAAKTLKKNWSYIEQFDVPSDKVRDRSAVFVREITQNGEKNELYVKIYANKQHPFQRLFRPGRSYTEVRNLLFFRKIGIATPSVIAWGERRNAIGRIVEEFIITESEKDTLQLDEFVAKHCPNPEQDEHKAMRLHIAKQLGEWTTRMHVEDFIHEDLKWRNILARPNGLTPKLFWIDCPRGQFIKQGPNLERKKLKDCATLDKLGRIECTKEERLTFLKSYLGKTATDEQLAEKCNDIETYRRKRFDSKDDEQRKDAQKNI